MSGIVGIFERDAKPIDLALLKTLTDFLSYRGPDAQDTWSDGPTGFGHAMLRVTDDSECERQPAALDRRFWITADVRIDCRSELAKKLQDAGRRLPRNITDPELVLHSYAVWREDCVHHLRGDFSFAIWDLREKQLFCARDHFGIKPFYYAEIGNTFIFSNTLNCVRLHSEVPDELNDDAVLDFLLVGFNCDEAATTFQAVRRLPPAHYLKVSTERIHLQRYWSIPTEGRIRYKRVLDYVEHFQSILRAAVVDRLRTKRVGIFMSGGLDSPAIAATVREAVPAVDLHAYTLVYESLIPEEEGPLAREIADFLRIPIRFRALDHLNVLEQPSPDLIWPEPVDDPCFAGIFDEFRMAEMDCRVVLSGQGGDETMIFQMWPYVKDMLRKREWGQLSFALPKFARVRQFPWRGLARRAQKIFGRGPLGPITPLWIAPRWMKTAEIRNRWQVRTAIRGTQVHPVRPRAQQALSQPQWALFFESHDPGVTHAAVEMRYPYLDVRVVEFLLALPPFPCFFHKNLLRRAMSGRLPPKILTRPKTPVPFDPLVARLDRGEGRRMHDFQWDKKMEPYVQRSGLSTLGLGMSPERARVDVRPFCLNFWLRAMRSVRYKSCREVCDGQTA